MARIAPHPGRLTVPPAAAGTPMAVTVRWHSGGCGCKKGCAGGSSAVVWRVGEGILVMKHSLWVLPQHSQMTKMGQ